MFLKYTCDTFAFMKIKKKLIKSNLISIPEQAQCKLELNFLFEYISSKGVLSGTKDIHSTAA